MLSQTKACKLFISEKLIFMLYIVLYSLKFSCSTGMYKDNVMPASGSKVKSLFGGLSKKADNSSSSSDDEQHHGGKFVPT